MTASTFTRKDQINEILKCGADPIYFIKTYVKIAHPTRGLVSFQTYPFQEECVEAYQEHRFVIVNKSRQLGLSTVSAAYCLWMALFQKEKNILVIATDMKVAMNFVRKVKGMLKELPKWLILPKVIGDSKQQIEFSNGSRVHATPTSDTAGRSEALSVLFVDECILPNTTVRIRNRITGEVRDEKVEDLLTSEEYHRESVRLTV